MKHLSRIAAATTLATCASIWCATVAADVYKSVDAQGNVVFSDKQTPGAKKIEVPPTTTITLPKLSPDAPKPAEASVANITYTKLLITFPNNDAAFYSGDGNFTVTTQIEPPLAASHELQLELDGKPYAVGHSGQFVMTNIDRGTHSLQLDVLSGGTAIQSGPAISFTIHRPIAKPKPVSKSN